MRYDRYLRAILLVMLISGVLMQPWREADARTAVTLAETVGQQCPDLHLELLSPSDLEYIFEFFLDKIPAKTKSRFEKADDARCRDVIAGLSCRDNAFLDTANKLKLRSRFEAFACKAGYVCKAQSDCGDGNLGKSSRVH